MPLESRKGFFRFFCNYP